MKIHKSLVSLGIAGGMALTASMAFAQGGYPGMAAGGYPAGGMSAGGYPGMGGGAVGAAGTTGANSATVTTTTDTVTSPDVTATKLPKTGGDPLSMTAAGSLLLSAGYAVRRKFRGR